MIHIARESIRTCLDEAKPLLAKHWREVALYQDDVPLDPDFDRYLRCDADGTMLTLTARDDGRLIGYSVFILFQHIHYRSCLVATNDVLFLDRDYRSGTTAGIRLLRESEAELSRERDRRGAEQIRVVWHVKPKNDWSPILARLGYMQEEIIMGKLIGHSGE